MTKEKTRLARKLPGRSQMERVRAARAYLNQAGSRDGVRQADMELHAFMSIFHPEYSDIEVKELSRGLSARR